MIDLLLGLFMETRAATWLARGLVVLLVVGVPGPLIWTVQYLANRQEHSLCSAIQPAITKIEPSHTTATGHQVTFRCPPIRLRP